MKLKLKQMKMPGSKKSGMADDMKKDLMGPDDEHDGPAESEEAQESPEEASEEGDDMSSLPPSLHGDDAGPDSKSGDSKLQAVSDDDLMAEIKKRGLLREMESQDQSQGYDADSESNPENVS